MSVLSCDTGHRSGYTVRVLDKVKGPVGRITQLMAVVSIF